MDSIPTTTPQQFCLRWHNHQASLLSSLPLLLDQSHLTDVTLSAEGRTVRAHRVVLSACSTYFSELFRTLEPPYHPIVVLPGTPFGALVALLTFMYSGEVNVFEEQISTLLALAETLGIKGLADFNGNLSKSSPKSDSSASAKESPGTPENHPSSPLSAQALHQKILSSSLDNLFCKSFPFYSNFINQQPLNYSRSSSRSRNDISTSNNSNDNNENRYQSPLIKKDNKNSSNFNSNSNNSYNDDNKLKSNYNNNNDNINNNNNSSSGGGNNYSKKIKISENMRKIDKIAENLRTGNKLNGSGNTNNPSFDAKFPILLPQAATSLMLKSSLHHFLSDENQSMMTPKTPENLFLDSPNHGNLNLLQQHATDLMAANHDLSPSHINNINNNHLDKNITASSSIIPHTSHAASQVTNLLPPATKPSNSKLYATCFICHKQLSNQYNLRVHLETHQNVRYACTVCTHVSRSKDALRKHVSYRHPGTPSPCDSETRRKRSKTNLANQQIKQELLNLEQHNSQLQQIIQSGQASQFTQLLSPAAANSLANLNLSLNVTGSSGSQHNTNEVGSPHHNNSSAANSPVPSIKSEVTATDSNENI